MAEKKLHFFIPLSQMNIRQTNFISLKLILELIIDYEYFIISHNHNFILKINQLSLGFICKCDEERETSL